MLSLDCVRLAAICGEIVESFDAIERYANDAGARRFEFSHIHRKLMCLNVAAFRVNRWVEINNDRAALPASRAANAGKVAKAKANKPIFVFCMVLSLWTYI